MVKQIAMTVVFDTERKQVLLHKREDFRIWALAGGHVEANESYEAAAIRETREETGYEVAAKRLVGQYQFPQTGQIVCVYEAYVTGGAAIERGSETLAVAWFPLASLPPQLAPNTRRYINDTLADYPQALHLDIHYSGAFLLFRAVALYFRDLRNHLFRAVQT